MNLENKNNDDNNINIKLFNIIDEFIKQNKKARRWKVIRFFILLVLFATIFYSIIYKSNVDNIQNQSEEPFVAEVILEGVIGNVGIKGVGISTDRTLDLIESAFKAEKSKAVILQLNSPGGTPVVAGQIYRGIKNLKKKYKNKKLYVVINDMCASGCYYIAVSGDEIYADKASIIGSIGVIMSGFGVAKAMEDLGIVRRVYKSGKYKSGLDMFEKEDPYVVEHFQTKLLDVVHKQFIDVVEESRPKITKDYPDLYTGLVWLGEESIKIGLIDGIGDASYVSKEKVGLDKRVLFEEKFSFVDYLNRGVLAVINSVFYNINTQKF